MEELTKRGARTAAAVLILITVLFAAAAVGCAKTEADAWPDATHIALSDERITVNGRPIRQQEGSAVYAANDIIYYEDRSTYSNGKPYGEGGDEDKHSTEEAAAHTVIHITEPGMYHISGTLSQGQIAVDLGEDAEEDPEAVVTLILDNAEITCTVAPAVIFYNVYECDVAEAGDNSDTAKIDHGDTTGMDNADNTEADNDGTAGIDHGDTAKEIEEAVPSVDTAGAGANIIIADDSVNSIDGSYVARIYKSSGKKKKLHKYDGAFYSKMSMNIDGDKKGNGVLTINAQNEGLDTERHLTINGGKINIIAQNDGINTNEDDMSITAINDGVLHITAGLGKEGDGIDSNGYIVINGGTVISAANPHSDCGLDSSCGTYVNGGTVVALGAAMDWAETGSKQVTMNLQFAEEQEAGDAIVVTDTSGLILLAYDPHKDGVVGEHVRAYRGAIISSPNFSVDETYYLYIGGTIQGFSANGLFNVDSITAYDDGVKQEYTDTVMSPGSPVEGGSQPPDGQAPSKLPDGQTPPVLPGGQNGQHEQIPLQPSNGNGPMQPANGIQPSDGSQPPEGENPLPKEASVRFYMAETVNSFNGICPEGTSSVVIINGTETESNPEI